MAHPIEYHNKHRLGVHNISFDIRDAAAGGFIRNGYVVQKFGENEDAGGTNEVLWSQSGTYTWLAAADTIVVTGGADDTGAGSGAQTVEVQGLDADYNLQSETVTMAGAGGVTTDASFLRVFRLKVLSAGAGGANAGAILAAATGGGNVGHIPIGYNQSMQAVYTTPAGHGAWLLRWYASSASNQTIDVFLWVRPFGQVFQVKHKIHVFRGFADERFEVPIQLGSKADVYMSTIASAASDVAGGFDIFGRKDE